MSTLAEVAVPRPTASTSVAGRVIFIVFGALALIAVLATLTTALWAHHEFTQPESVVAAQSLMLAHDGTLYYDLNRYPYTICAYTPIFYLLEAALSRLGMWVYTGGRMISFLAMLGVLWFVWRLLMHYTADRAAACTGVILCASSNLLLNWGTVAQVDMLAVLFALAAFERSERNSLVWAGIFAALAFFTKQTMLACPAAIFAVLFFKHRKSALLFAACLGSVAAAVSLGINFATDGRFLANTVFANMNPFAWEKVAQHVRYILIVSGQLLLVLAVCARKALRKRAVAPFVYLGFAACILAATAPKIGSDSNYQIEFTILLIVCACLSLDAMNFYSLCRARSKTWITLLQLPLAIYAVLNLRIFEPALATRIAREQQFRAQVAALSRSIGEHGRVLSTEIDAMVHLRGRIEVEPLIYKLLVAAGRVDPEPLRRDLLDRSRFSAVVLYEDVHQTNADRDLEMPTLPDPQIAAIRENYRLTEHIPGPYLNGIYVYKPVGR